MLGYEIRVRSSAMKLQCVSVLLCGMFLYWSWEAILISYFAVPLRTFPFHTLEEFVTNTDKKVRV